MNWSRYFKESEFDGLPLAQKRLTLAFMIAACAWLASLAWKEHRIGRDGVVAEARVLRKYASKTAHVDTYNLVYSFSPEPGPLVAAQGTTNRAHYEGLQPGDAMKVRYLAEKPEVSEPWQGDNRKRVYGAAILLLLSTAAVLGMIRSTERHQETSRPKL